MNFDLDWLPFETLCHELNMNSGWLAPHKKSGSLSLKLMVGLEGHQTYIHRDSAKKLHLLRKKSHPEKKVVLTEQMVLAAIERVDEGRRQRLSAAPEVLKAMTPPPPEGQSVPGSLTAKEPLIFLLEEAVKSKAKIKTTKDGFEIN